MNHTNALDLLQKMLGPNASFRPGQYETIDSVINKGGKQLLVQKTGWGKSIIYFILTKIFRDTGKGPTLLISPLLSLMRNQIYHASKIGIHAESINSTNYKDWDKVISQIANNEVDILLVSPERLSNQTFIQEILPAMKGIGMFVVDEVHCISDWGHDFRPDYRRIRNLIRETFDDIPILGTTATANDRVVKDVEEQFGENVITLRGPLARSGLKFQNIILGSTAERLAWLAENIPKIQGSGIVYCLTRKDAYRVSEWLKLVGIDSYHYWGGTIPDEEGDDLSPQLEQDLIDNDIKVLIATSALGMGFDKPDLSFVVHYQSPGSAVAYYQQVGRAGRAVDESYGILLHGNEDDEILDYFLKEAFPTEEESNEIIQHLESVDEARLGDIKKSLNLKDGRISKAIKHLEIDGFIAKDSSKYSRTPKPWIYDKERVEKLKEIRLEERQKIADYISYNDCLMKFITNELDDPESQKCGICSNCSKQEFFPKTASKELIFKALEFLNQDYQLIEPRKRWPAGIFNSTIIPPEQHNEQGRSMCLLEDAGWGIEIKKCFRDNTTVSDDFLDAAAHLITEVWNPKPFPDVIVDFIGSHYSAVANFGERLSERLNINYWNTLDPDELLIQEGKRNFKMSHMKNSQQKVVNGLDKWKIMVRHHAIGGLAQQQEAYFLNHINDEITVNNDSMDFHKQKRNILLIDDYVDSRWTFTILGGMLSKLGHRVYPFSLGMVIK
jgi:ATP-dependent DNA helicase RecQ|tara:strand:- start:788 stop:2968 length:2181 start_codon:yes stop_codon:yes gene_type:complete